MEGDTQQEDDKRKRKQQFTWDLAATSQSPVLSIFGSVGTWGVRTAEEEKNPVRCNFPFSKPLPSKIQFPKGHPGINQGCSMPSPHLPFHFPFEDGTPKPFSAMCRVGGASPHPVSTHPAPTPGSTSCRTPAQYQCPSDMYPILYLEFSPYLPPHKPVPLEESLHSRMSSYPWHSPFSFKDWGGIWERSGHAFSAHSFWDCPSGLGDPGCSWNLRYSGVASKGLDSSAHSSSPYTQSQNFQPSVP